MLVLKDENKQMRSFCLCAIKEKKKWKGKMLTKPRLFASILKGDGVST